MAVRPELTLFKVWNSEAPDEGHPVFDGHIGELAHEVVQNEFESLDNALESALIVGFYVTFENVVGLFELAADLGDEVVSPL